MGLTSFVSQFYQDCKAGITTGWWNEKFSRRNERVSVEYQEKRLKNTFELINYIKDNAEDISEEDIETFNQRINRAFPALKYKRVYYWEVKDEVESEEVEVEDTVEELPEQEEVEVENTEQEDTTEVVPDFEYAKKLEDKQELKAYAKSFGYSIDSRKSLGDMIKSFQGKYHATKNK